MRRYGQIPAARPNSLISPAVTFSRRHKPCRAILSSILAALPSLGAIRYLDARDQAAFDAGHAPGAVRVPIDAWDKAAKAADIGFDSAALLGRSCWVRSVSVRR